MNWYKKAQDYSKLTKEELANLEFPVIEGGHSITPKDALERRKNKDFETFETLYDLATYDDPWRFYESLGKGWEGHWDNKVTPSLHLINKIKNNEPIMIYRASNMGGILPGAYVTESREYAIFHGQSCIPGKYKIYQMKVYPDELMSHGDPHEFVYIPRSVDIAHKRLV